MKEASRIVKEIQAADSVVITGHRSADGDSVGSALGLLRFIRALGKEATVCHPDPCPGFLDWVKHDDVILDFESDHDEVVNAMENADLIFSLDYNAPDRMGEDMGLLLESSQARKILIDHHPDPSDFADITESHTDVCSTCQLIFELIVGSGNEKLLDADIAEPIYLGIMTDTGSFRFNSVTPRTHEIAARLLETDMKHSLIHESTYDNNRIEKLKLRGYAISEKLEVLGEAKVAIISLSEEELDKFNFVRGDTDGLVNVALSVEGVEVAVFFTEHYEKIKISFRSKGAPVNLIARDHFNGGGHKYAAGGTSLDTLEATIAKFKSLIPEYFGA